MSHSICVLCVCRVRVFEGHQREETSPTISVKTFAAAKKGCQRFAVLAVAAAVVVGCGGDDDGDGDLCEKRRHE